MVLFIKGNPLFSNICRIIKYHNRNLIVTIIMQFCITVSVIANI